MNAMKGVVDALKSALTLMDLTDVLVELATQYLLITTPAMVRLKTIILM